jgi:ketosteroid isomerase-like protein
MELEKRLRRIEDWIEIQTLMGKYRDYSDSFDFEGFCSLFTEDALFDQRGTPFAMMKGRKKIFDTATAQIVGNWDATQHSMINVQVDIDGDKATGSGECVYVAVPKGAPKTHYFQAFNHYDFEFVRTGEGWRISQIIGQPLADNGGGDWSKVFGQQDNITALNQAVSPKATP